MNPDTRLAHDRSSRRPAWAVGIAILIVLSGAAANNVTVATQDMRDYLPLLYFAVVSFLSAIGLLAYGAVRGGVVLKVIAAFAGLLAIAQLVDASGRLYSIATAAAG